MPRDGQSLFDEAGSADTVRPVEDKAERAVPVCPVDPVRTAIGHEAGCCCWECLKAAGLVPGGQATQPRSEMDRYADPNGD